MDSIRICTKCCFILFDRWLGESSLERNDRVMEAQINSNLDPAVLRANDLESRIPTLRQRAPDSTDSDDGSTPRDAVLATKVPAEELNDEIDVENHIFRFRLWAVHNSALSERRDSLDWRLRKSTMASSVMVDLLTDLSHTILMRKDPTATLALIQDNVGNALDQLFRYSRGIRRSGGLRRIVKATDHIDYDDFGNNLGAKFRDSVKVYLDATLGKASVHIRARLVETICLRQQSLAFQKSRRENKAVHLDKPTSARITSQIGSVISAKTSIAVSKQQSRSAFPRPLGPGKPKFASSSATTFLSKISPSTEAQVESAEMAFPLDSLPQRPKIRRGQREQECPYCFILCPIEEFTDSSWPRHVVGDIMPFICPFEICSKPNILYDSDVTWLNHLRVDHARKGWTCLDSDHDEPLFFTAKADLISHITEDHDDSLSVEELEQIAEDCCSGLKNDSIFERCPFDCEVDTSDFSCDKLNSHIAFHLLLLSQISLSGHDTIDGIEFSISTDMDTASERNAIDSHVNNSRETPNTNVIQDDDNMSSTEEQQLDVLDYLTNTPVEHLSEISLPVPWSIELEAWTKAGNWDIIRKKNRTMDTYTQSTDMFLQPLIKSYLEKKVDDAKSDSGDDTSNGSDDSTSKESDDGTPEYGGGSLRRTLIRKFRHSAFDKIPQDFLPEGTLDKYIEPEVVRHELAIAGSTSDEQELIEFVCTRAQKIFAIVIFARLKNPARVLKWFRSRDLNDTHLPIQSDGKLLRKDIRWDFLETQWAFCAPVFSIAHHTHYELHEASILPFLSKSVTEGHGAFSVVSQYVIHRSHIQPAPQDHGVFALKEIKSIGDEQEAAQHWEQEVLALRFMNELNEEHILRFVTAFRRNKRNGGKEHYLVFEWADGGNLRSLWRAMSPELTATLVRDIVGQMHGLAKALEAAHNSSKTGVAYRHGDLKPENFLVFRHGGSIGTLKIGDWGEAKGHLQVTELRRQNTTARYGTRRYEAPEIETGIWVKFRGQSTNRRSRLHDIWSMGCIFLEFLIWLLYGTKGLDSFNQELGDERFFQLGIQQEHRVARVHDVAVRWMEHMAKDSRCRRSLSALGDLLELVRTSLLVVELPRRLGTNVVEALDDHRTSGHSPDGNPTVSAGASLQGTAIPTISVTTKNSTIEDLPPQPYTGRARCLASELRTHLGHILSENKEASYWHDPNAEESPEPEPGDLKYPPHASQMEFNSSESLRGAREDEISKPHGSRDLSPPYRDRLSYHDRQSGDNDHDDSRFHSDYYHYSGPLDTKCGPRVSDSHLDPDLSGSQQDSVEVADAPSKTSLIDTNSVAGREFPMARSTTHSVPDPPDNYSPLPNLSMVLTDDVPQSQPQEPELPAASRDKSDPSQFPMSLSHALSRGRGNNIVGNYDGSQATLHYETLDASFYVREKSFFTPGRMFAIILSENAGSTAATDYNSSISEVRYQGNLVYTSVRRFIVVRQKREFCFACPVFTYSGRATSKPGVRAEEHAVAYDIRSTPLLLPGETGITKAPIGVEMEGNEALSKASRICFGIHNPIQHNVKVKNIGCVCDEHIPSLISHWREEEEREGQQASEVTASGHEEATETLSTHEPMTADSLPIHSPEWSPEHQQWLQRQWDPERRLYYWNRHNGTSWEFFAWIPRGIPR